MISRRSAMAAFAGFFTLPVIARAGENPNPGWRFRAIQVDVSPLRQSGDPTSAEFIAMELPGQLQHYFGAYLTPGDRRAPVLRARIDSVRYGIPGSAGGATSTTTMDYIEGVGIVISGAGRVVAAYPLTCTILAHPDDLDVTGGSARLRIVNLTHGFAHWLPGKMGLWRWRTPNAPPVAGVFGSGKTTMTPPRGGPMGRECAARVSKAGPLPTPNGACGAPSASPDQNNAGIQVAASIAVN
jgi:hypothetical protein